MTPIAWAIFLPLVTVALTGLFLVLREIVRFPPAGAGSHPAAPSEPEAIQSTPLPALPASVREPAPRGSLPPARPDLIPMWVTYECSEGMCGLCPPGTGCECTCGHVGAEIVKRNTAKYDLTHPAVTEGN